MCTALRLAGALLGVRLRGFQPRAGEWRLSGRYRSCVQRCRRPYRLSVSIRFKQVLEVLHVCLHVQALLKLVHDIVNILLKVGPSADLSQRVNFDRSEALLTLHQDHLDHAAPAPWQ